MEEVFEVLEGFVYVFLVLAILLNVYTVRKFGKGFLNVLFLSFGFCAFFLCTSFVFSMLAHGGLIALEDVTYELWHHVLIYLSFFSLIWGGYRIKRGTEMGDTTGVNHSDSIVYAILFGIMSLIFMFSSRIDGLFVSAAADFLEKVERLGLHHFTVFLLGGISALYLLYIKGNWGLLSKSLTLIIWFIALIALQHFWETLTESWQLLLVDDEIVEGVELLLVLPALALYCISQWKIIKFIKG